MHVVARSADSERPYLILFRNASQIWPEPFPQASRLFVLQTQWMRQLVNECITDYFCRPWQDSNRFLSRLTQR